MKKLLLKWRASNLTFGKASADANFCKAKGNGSGVSNGDHT
jgi:hypothetical protein